MKPIDKEMVQEEINRFIGKSLYLHLETTNGAYTGHWNDKDLPVGAYIRNAAVTCLDSSIRGEKPYRVGVKTDTGWVYAEGLTDYEVDEEGRLLMAGHNSEGKVAVALQFSLNPF